MTWILKIYFKWYFFKSAQVPWIYSFSSSFFQQNLFPDKKKKILVGDNILSEKTFFEKKNLLEKNFLQKKKNSLIFSQTEFCLRLHIAVVFCMQSFNFICHFGRHILKTPFQIFVC